MKDNPNPDGIFKTEQAAKLDAPGRAEELQPDEVLRKLKAQPGLTGVDLGSGTGVFAIPMAELAGDGDVYAVDRAEVMHDHLREKDPPANLQTVTADVTATGLPDGIADVVTAGFILHEIKEPERLLKEAARLMKQGGRLAVIDWREDTEYIGPPRSRRISRERVERMFKEAGLRFDEYINWTDNHFVAVGTK